MDNERPITPDDIEDVYIAADDDRRLAASRALLGEAYVLASVSGKSDREGVDYDIRVDWRADQVASTTLLVGLIHIGIQEFGESWQRALKTTLIPLLG